MRYSNCLIFGLMFFVSSSLFAGGGNLNPDFNLSAATVKAGEKLTITDTSTRGSCVGGINGWSWDFGEGARPTSANSAGPHEISFDKPGTKSIRLEIRGNSCSPRFIMKTVEVIGPPIPTMSQWTLYILCLILLSIAVVRILAGVKNPG